MPAPSRRKAKVKRASSSTNPTFVLAYPDVAKLLNRVSLASFVTALTDAIIATYHDPHLDSMTRTGWPRPPDTLEVMGCQSTDYTCVKIISSNPSLVDPRIPIVTGTLVCTEVGTDQARLVCDAAVLTPLRTASSTAVVMREYVPDIETIGIIGAGREGTSHGFILAALLGNVRNVLLCDAVTGRAALAADEVKQLLRRPDMQRFVRSREIAITPIQMSERAQVFDCDAIVTATYGRTSVVNLREDKLRPDAFIAAVGADLEGKQELDSSVYDRAKFIADDLVQCLHEGELQHAAKRLKVHTPDGYRGSHKGSLSEGRFTSVAALLQDSSTFRALDEPITVYDSTGFSGQDLALARVLLQFLAAQGWEAISWNPTEKGSLVDLLARYQ
jgi:ornithine cyclodeaminase/alanine dehydrogenase-like protein (mu-crystallin family)